jgi:hypothetical protein
MGTIDGQTKRVSEISETKSPDFAAILPGNTIRPNR